MRGSLLLLDRASRSSARWPFSGLGLLAAARPTTIEGVSGIMNLVMVPMWIFSGIFFSTERFPAAMQPFVQALPLTALNDALRGVMLEGAGVGPVFHELALLAVWGRELRHRREGVPVAMTRRRQWRAARGQQLPLGGSRRERWPTVKPRLAAVGIRHHPRGWPSAPTS